MFNFIFSILTPEPLKHFGVCDASAAIPLGQDQFIVGNDEADEELGNLLRVYSSQESGKVTTLPISINEFVNTRKEIDLEAVTELNGLIYWITSHGRNSSGEIKPKRHQLFATKFTDDDNVLEQVGQSYTRFLYWDLLTESKLKSLRENEMERLAPKLGGINIEGLTATPEGDLLIGFRSPLTENKALLVPLKNPLELMTQTGTKAQLGEPILLDLDGLGVRSIEYCSVIQAYIIIAGEVGGGDRFALYLWSGKPNENPELIDLTLPTDFRPESVLFYPHLRDRFQLLSDDGTIQRIDGQECKTIKDSDNPEKYFRSIWVKMKSN
jgi:hypothetical protein